MGLWDEATRTVWLDCGLTGVERRCTLVHELVHAERGDVPCEDPVLAVRQERIVDREAARRLVPVALLADGLRWTVRAEELAAVLEVDLATLRTRLRCLTDAERAAIGERLGQ